MYRRVQHIILHSNGFRERLLGRGVPPEKMTAIIGWTNESQLDRRERKIPSNMLNLRGLKILYAGNIGPAQALDSVLDSARVLQQEGHGEDATFCFLGSGLSRDALAAQAVELEVENVIFLPQVSQAEVGAYLASADVLLVHLRDDPLFEITMPSKTQAYMVAGRPILMGVRGEAGALIESAQGGLTVAPEDSHALASAVRRFVAMSEEERRTLGVNARTYYWENLSMEKGMAHFIELFARVRRESA